VSKVTLNVTASLTRGLPDTNTTDLGHRAHLNEKKDAVDNSVFYYTLSTAKRFIGGKNIDYSSPTRRMLLAPAGAKSTRRVS